MLKTEIRGRTLVLTLDRPEVRNAWNPALARGLHEAWKRLVSDDELWSCVVTGTGAFFSAGLDLKDPPVNEAPLAMPNLSVTCDKPIITAVEGGAIGYGAVFCLLSDMVVAGQSAYFLYPEGRMGAFQGMMGGFPGRLQYKAGLQWIMTGARMPAARAREIGMVNEVVPDGTATESALALAEQINQNTPLVIQAMKALALSTVTKGPMEENFRNNQLLARIVASEDYKEGVAAFLQRRPTQFKGR